MSLKFVEQPTHISNAKVATTTWACEASDKDTFLVVRIKLQDLMNIRAGKVNFFGHEKPKLGTLEELTDVYTASWLYLDSAGVQRMRPLVGNFNGGFATHREAVQMCDDVWRNKARYRRNIQRVAMVMPQRPKIIH
jgi:hypothetical protein